MIVLSLSAWTSQFWIEYTLRRSHSDVDTVISEDEGGVRGRKLSVRHLDSNGGDLEIRCR